MSSRDAKPLKGQRALVTGAGRGIGRAIALAYAQAGADIVIAARTRGDIDAVASEAAALGSDALAVVADIGDEAQVQALFARIADTGALDIAMLNAGGMPARGPVASSETSAWKAAFDQNMFGAYLCARQAIPLLKLAGGGKIILMGSGLGHRGLADYAAYSCAKAAQWMLTRVLAQELAGDAISVNEIVPGPVRSTIGDFDIGKNDRFASEWAKRPEDVADLALMLASFPNNGPSAQSFSLMRRDG